MRDVEINSEIKPLELIVTSSPGPELDLMLPVNLERYQRMEDGSLQPSPDYLLFDDLVLLSAMQSEHRTLDDVLRAMTGDQGLLRWKQLLVETLGLVDARRLAIHETLALEAELYRPSAADLAAGRTSLERLDAPRLADALVSGRDPMDHRAIFRWPIPNALFARDLAAVAGPAFIYTYAAEPARMREMLLTRIILGHHRRFRDADFIDIAMGRPEPGLTLEGGDIQIFDNRVAVVGVGIRTTRAAVERLARALFERSFEAVLMVEIPKQRGAMHLDTLLTRIDEEHVLVYPPLVTDPTSLGTRVTRLGPRATKEQGADLLGALAELGIPLGPIFCGGMDPGTQAREQWSDGANAFALAPGIIVCYGRNVATLRELNRAGYEVVTPEMFCANALYYVNQRRRIVVALMGHELVRGRGGPRCLTLPLRRQA
ncbi:MAG: arginine deiminase family protein [Myxococcota bacterium]